MKDIHIHLDLPAPAQAPKLFQVNETPAEIPQYEQLKKELKKVLNKSHTSKVKRSPQFHSNSYIHGMINVLQSLLPKTTKIEALEAVLAVACDKVAGKPAVLLPHLAPDTLRIMANFAAKSEKFAETTISEIIKVKFAPSTQAKLTDELAVEVEVGKYGEIRRTMMRQATIPITPELPEKVEIGIEALRQLKRESDDISNQDAYDVSIEVLKAYRPPRYDILQWMQDPDIV